MSKPKKNRVHCSLAQRSKMLFSTQEEAERFLEYNTKSLDGWRKGKVPLRAYYCVACGGWHVSSKIFPTSTIKEDKEFVDNVISSYKSQQEFTHYTSRRKTQKEEKIEKDAKMFKEMNAKLNNLLYIIGGKKCDYLCCEKLDECKNNLIEIENTLKVLTIKDEKKLASINNRIELAKEKLERGYFKCSLFVIKNKLKTLFRNQLQGKNIIEEKEEIKMELKKLNKNMLSENEMRELKSLLTIAEIPYK